MMRFAISTFFKKKDGGGVAEWLETWIWKHQVQKDSGSNSAEGILIPQHCVNEWNTKTPALGLNIKK